MTRVTLETKCWEGDWEAILKGDRLRRLALFNRHPFADRVLLINNVSDHDKVRTHAERAVEEGSITRYVVVKDHIEDALRFFGVSRESFGPGWVYSIAELVGLYLCDTEFLLHFSGDSLPERPVEWVEGAVGCMDLDPRIKVANLAWNGRYDEARGESQAETADFWIGQGFSDQCYLVRTRDFRAPIYAHTHPASERYPAYGGELFEKRVDAWMRSHGWLRATYKHASYCHRNFPKPLAHRFSARWTRLRRAIHGLARRGPER
jgi:hypothetical protein